MAMSRKQFVALADILKTARVCVNNDRERTIVDDITYNIAGMCQRENSNFDRGRFYAAADHGNFGPGVQA